MLDGCGIKSPTEISGLTAQCGQCGNWHTGPCARFSLSDKTGKPVRVIEFEENGAIKRIEYYV